MNARIDAYLALDKTANDLYNEGKLRAADLIYDAMDDLWYFLDAREREYLNARSTSQEDIESRRDTMADVKVAIPLEVAPPEFCPKCEGSGATDVFGNACDPTDSGAGTCEWCLGGWKEIR